MQVIFIYHCDAETPTCGWDYISKISETYDINTRLGKFDRTLNTTNAPMLEAGDNVELKCTDSIPKRRPVVDLEDDDKLDGVITLFCMSPKSVGELGRYKVFISLLRKVLFERYVMKLRLEFQYQFIIVTR